MRKSYRLNEADISLPDYWKDTTINAFILPSSKKAGEAEATFVITRDGEAKSDSVEHYADWKPQSDKDGPQQMLVTAERYLSDSIDFDSAWNRKNYFWGELEALLCEGKCLTRVNVGFAAANVVTTAALAPGCGIRTGDCSFTWRMELTWHGT